MSIFDIGYFDPKALSKIEGMLRSLVEMTGCAAARLYRVTTKATLAEYGQSEAFDRLQMVADLAVPVATTALPAHSGQMALQLCGETALDPARLRLVAVIGEAISGLLGPQNPLYLAGSEALQHSEKQRQLIEQRFRLLVENSMDDFFIHDAKGRFLDVNDAACRNLGYSRAELLTMSAHDISTDLSQHEKEELYRLTPPGASARVSARHRRKDGSLFPVDVLISCHLFDGEKIFLGMVRDISVQVEARTALEALNAALEERVASRSRELTETAELLQAIMDNASDAISLCDLDQRYQMVNLAACRLLDRAAEDLIGKRVDDVIDAQNPSAFAEDARARLIAGQSVSSEETLYLAGKQRIMSVVRNPRRDQHGNVVGIVSLARDITYSKRAEVELRLERERLALATQTAGMGYVIIDPSGEFLSFSDEWTHIFGTHTLEHSIALMFSLVHPDDLALVEAEYALLIQGESRLNVVYRIQRPDGALRWVSSSGRHIPASAFSPARIVVVSHDVTERHLAQRALQTSYQALLRAEKLARIGSWSFDAASATFESSAMMRQMNGLPEGEEITIDTLRRVMSPVDFERVSQAITKCLADGQPYSVDVTHFHTNGPAFAAEIRGEANFDADGKVVGLSGTVQDVSEREAARAQMTAIADALPNGAIYRVEYAAHSLDLDAAYASQREARITYISAGIEKMIGISAEALIEDASLLNAAIHADDRPRYIEGARRSMLTLSVFECDFRLIRSDGRQLWLRVSSAPRIMDNHRIWDGIILDVTPTYEAAEALRLAKEKAEAAERAKSDFLATMSHEIRTPMNSVIGMTRLAMQTELSTRQKNYLDKINTSARILLAIINDTLDLSRIEAGALELEETDFSLDRVIEAVTDTTALKADEKGLEYLYSIAPDVPRHLRGDPMRLGQVLINLVGNAVKFTEHGAVEIAVALQPADPPRAQMLRFSVRDSGIGLTEEQISNLFRPFSQADSRTARRYGGTGLGLSICKQLVGLMGGEIWVESQPAQGSTFMFTMPLQAASQQAPKGLHYYTSKRALIVDDTVTARESLSQMIEHFGIQCQSVSSGAAALAALHQANAQDKPFDLVLMDWRMPGMDGIETARHIRDDPSLKSTPAVLMVTSHAREEIALQIDQLELQGLLIKPVTESMLFNAVQSIFGSLHETAPAETAQSLLAEMSRSSAQRLKGRRILIVDDNLFNLEVARDFLELAQAEVTTAESGHLALAALGRQSFDAILMDMQMPEMDGIETTRQIRKNPAWAQVPIIALTAQARIEDQRLTEAVGMNAHLTKPVDEIQLYDILDHVLLEAEAAKQEVQMPHPIDRDRALARVRQDPARMIRMIDLFLRDFKDSPAQLRHLLAAGAGQDLAALAHRIKGTVGYFAADALSAKAAALEDLLRDDPMADTTALTTSFAQDLEAMIKDSASWLQCLQQQLAD